MSRIIKINNQAGSIEHYYHFILGYTFPFIHWYIFNKKNINSPIIMRYCGDVLAPLFNSIKIPNVILKDKETFLELLETANPNNVTVLPGWDRPDYFIKTKLLRVANFIETALQKEITQQENSIKKKDYILIIGRKPPNEYYLRKDAENPSSGTQRRSIPNIYEILKYLDKKNIEYVYTELEDLTLGQQIALFKNARCIVAQHGASLTNIIFCNPNVSIVEITPVLSKNTGMYRLLAYELNLKHEIIFQHTCHSPVEPKEIYQKIYNK
jgi:hypothetical protein